tara:strand:- start:203 stop:607 length:405 start_codon:yes stop_codon:yes gene_type:complete
MISTLPNTHKNLDRTFYSREYDKKTDSLINVEYTLTDLEKQVMDLFPIDWYVDDLEVSDYGLDDPSEWLLDWSDCKVLIKGLDITQNQLKGVIGSLINKGALEVESRGDTAAEKLIFGQDLYWLSSRFYETLVK